MNNMYDLWSFEPFSYIFVVIFDELSVENQSKIPNFNPKLCQNMEPGPKIR